MARHQRQGSRTVYTHARAAETAFQLELPGEAGIVPPARPDTGPPAWIIAEPNTPPRQPAEVPPAQYAPPPVIAPQPAQAQMQAPPPAPRPGAAQPQPAPAVAQPQVPPPPVGMPSPGPIPEMRSAPDTARLEDPPAPADPPEQAAAN